MRGLEDAPLALGLSRTIMIAGVCVRGSGVAHPFLAPDRQTAVETQRVGAWGGLVDASGLVWRLLLFAVQIRLRPRNHLR
jgi:hypothetical protein